jgi:CHAD domain-containing protein
MQQQLQKLERSLQQAVTGSEDGVHDVRVASRRLEEPLALCRPWAGGKDLQRSIRQLKRIRRAFRFVRELDVLQHTLLSDDRSPLPLLSAKHQELARRALSARRASQAGRANKKAERVDLEALARSLATVEDELTHVEDEEPRWIAKPLRELVADRARRVLQSDPADRARPDLHRTRVGLKKLRYAIELAETIQGDRWSPLMEQLREAQDRLGYWNDELQAARWLTALARRRRCLVEQPDWSAAMLKGAARLVEQSQEMAESFVTSWADLRGAIEPFAACSGTPKGAAASACRRSSKRLKLDKSDEATA